MMQQQTFALNGNELDSFDAPALQSGGILASLR